MISLAVLLQDSKVLVKLQPTLWTKYPGNASNTHNIQELKLQAIQELIMDKADITVIMDTKLKNDFAAGIAELDINQPRLAVVTLSGTNEFLDQITFAHEVRKFSDIRTSTFDDRQSFLVDRYDLFTTRERRVRLSPLKAEFDFCQCCQKC